MGVADNKTYRDIAPYFKNYKSTAAELPSVNGNPYINSTIKDNKEFSNAEIEGGEIVLQPDLSAIFKAVGKKHSRGGIDVLLRPNAFVFSDHKSLSVSDREKELFELKKGGTTPADVVKKNVNLKHYNTLVNNLSDVHKDDIAKKSSAMMIEKYIATLGNIAYIQENKKDFPQGLPAFSIGTAPVFEKNLNDKIMENKQYMKYGGTTQNPYYQRGAIYQYDQSPFMYPNKLYKDAQKARVRSSASGNVTTPNNTVDPVKSPFLYPYNSNPGINPLSGAIPPAAGGTSPSDPINNLVKWGLHRGDRGNAFKDRYGVSNAADKFDELSDWDSVTKELGYTGPKNNLSFQKWLYNSGRENKAVIDKWHDRYNEGPIAGMMDGNVGIRWANSIKDILNLKRSKVNSDVPAPNLPGLAQRRSPDVNPDAPVINDEILPGSVSGDEQKGLSVDWKFTPWQKLSMLHSLGNHARVKRYMPYRSRYNATYNEDMLMNPEQVVGDMQSAANQQVSSLNTLNPILRNSQAASTYGQLLNAIPGVRSQYDNQNAAIVNQGRMYRNQVKNNETAVNMKNDQDYYRESVIGRQNFDNMKKYTGDLAANELMRNVETNQKLAYNLLTQQNPVYDFDWKTGSFIRNNMDIRDVNNTSQGDYIQQLLKGLDPSTMTIDEKIRLARELNRGKALEYLPQNTFNSPPPFYRKGGRKNPYKH